MVEQVKTLNALEGTAGRSAPRERNSSYQQPGRSNSQPASSGVHRNNNQANHYVTTLLAFNNSFGGRIARFGAEWEKLTLDPWVLSTVGEGFRLEFLSEPFQSSVQPNTSMDPHQQACCEKEVASLLEKGAVVKAQDGSFISSIFLIAKRLEGFRPIINL